MAELTHDQLSTEVRAQRSDMAKSILIALADMKQRYDADELTMEFIAGYCALNFDRPFYRVQFQPALGELLRNKHVTRNFDEVEDTYSLTVDGSKIASKLLD